MKYPRIDLDNANRLCTQQFNLDGSNRIRSLKGWTGAATDVKTCIGDNLGYWRDSFDKIIAPCCSLSYCEFPAIDPNQRSLFSITERTTSKL